MTREEFVDQWKDELSGLLLAAFSEAESRRLAGEGGSSANDAAAMGRWMLRQLHRARGLLERQYDAMKAAMTPPKEAPKQQPANGPLKPGAK